MKLELNSADKLRTNFPFLSPQDLMSLFADGTLSASFEATINATAVWRKYGGRVDVRGIFRAFGEVIAPATDFQTLSIKPSTAYAVATLLLELQPELWDILTAMNGGVRPEINPPIEEDTTPPPVFTPPADPDAVAQVPVQPTPSTPDAVKTNENSPVETNENSPEQPIQAEPKADQNGPELTKPDDHGNADPSPTTSPDSGDDQAGVPAH